VSDAQPEEWTELYDPEVPEMHMVGKGANGFPEFLIIKQDAEGGLFEADYVRELIAKADAEHPPATDPRETVTMSGSPAAIAALIHGAAVRKATPEPAPVEDDVAKAEESTATQNDLPDSAFAYIESGGTKDEHGRTVPRSLRHFNIHDAAHVRNALSRAPQSPFGDKAMPKIRAAAKRFGVDVSKAEQAAPETNEVSKDMDGSAGMPLDEGMDGMDPTVILAMPEEEAPGDPNDPGSPAWESIDAATALKWTAIAARLRSALGIMSDREMLEAATADPSDADNAMDLDDAACAVDFVISTLAPFAVDEQAEADEGTMAMEMVGKAMSTLDPAHLDTVETLGTVRKAGRALSSANESALRAAVKALQQILASLPRAADAPAPASEGAMTKESGLPVAKTANEEPDMPQTTTAEDTTTASGQAPAMGSASPDPQPVAGTAVTDVTKTADAPVDQAAFAEIVKQLAAVLNSQAPVAKTDGAANAEQTPAAPIAKAEETTAVETAADEPVIKAEQPATPDAAPVAEPANVQKAEKPPQVAIYDANGNLVGTVDPGEITMLAPARAPEPAAKADDAAPDEPAAPAAEAPATPPTDLAPQPPAAAGVPADAVPADDAMTKQAANGQPDSNTATLESSAPADILKQALADYSATQGQALAAQMADVRKGLEDRNAALEEVVKNLQAQIEERITRIENAPPVYAIASNGAMPDPRHLRGQNQGALAVDPAIGPMLKARLANSDDATEQKQIADEMTERANTLFQQLQAGARQR